MLIKHGLKNKIKLLLVAVLFFTPINIAKADTSPQESGLMLDISRHFYDINTLKKFIDVLHESHGTFLHLHFSDDQNYAIESAILGQTSENALQKDGLFINPNTQKPFLSYAQLDELIHYAKAKNIELVPEVDSPAHMNAIFTLLAHKYGNDYVQQRQSSQFRGELDMRNEQSIALMQELIGEVIWIFGDSSRHFHLGGDEFAYDEENSGEFIQYINKLAQTVIDKGLTPRIWNDGLLTANLAQLNPSVQITYWSYDGDASNPDDIRYRRKIRASLPDILQQGFQVLNYNAYYLYFNPNARQNLTEDSQFAKQDLQKNWHLGVWDGQNTQNAVKPTQLLGAALAIWGENASSLPSAQIQQATAPLLKTALEKINTHK